MGRAGHRRRPQRLDSRHLPCSRRPNGGRSRATPRHRRRCRDGGDHPRLQVLSLQLPPQPPPPLHRQVPPLASCLLLPFSPSLLFTVLFLLSIQLNLTIILITQIHLLVWELKVFLTFSLLSHATIHDLFLQFIKLTSCCVWFPRYLILFILCVCVLELKRIRVGETWAEVVEANVCIVYTLS